MAAYGNLDPAKAGMFLGLTQNIESIVADVDFEFGDPVFVDEGANLGVAPDSTDASLKFAGVAAISQRSYVDSEGKYIAGDLVNVARGDKIYVPVIAGETGLTNKAAYIENDTTSPNYKKFTAVTVGNYATGGFFRSEIINGVALVELRGLN